MLLDDRRQISALDMQAFFAFVRTATLAQHTVASDSRKRQESTVGSERRQVVAARHRDLHQTPHVGRRLQ